jgi:hypothetical protein
LIAAPVLTVEETWHGRPMIDQPGFLWVISGAIVLMAFCAGGLVAAHRSGDRNAGLQAGAYAAAVLVAADIFRRSLITHQRVAWPIVSLWAAASVAATAICWLGGHVAARSVSNSTTGPSVRCARRHDPKGGPRPLPRRWRT